MLGLASTVSSGSLLESLYSITLDGTDDYIDLGTGISLGTADFTISLWVKTADFHNKYFISEFVDSDNRWFFEANSDDPPELSFVQVIGGTAHTTYNDTSGNINLDSHQNVWTHIAISADRDGNVKGYVNGVAGSAITGQATNLTTTANTFIGRYSSTYSAIQVDEVSIWNAALDEASVQAIYNKGGQYDLTSGLSIGTESLVAYYRMGNGTFDDKINGVIHDQHASGFGSEMVTNGHFNTNTAGWTNNLSGDSTITQGSFGGRDGVARVVIDTNGQGDRFEHDITWEKDCLYYFSVDVYLLSGKFRIDGDDLDIVGAGPGSDANVLGTITYDAAVDDRWRTLTGYARGGRTGGVDEIWIRSSSVAAEFYIDNLSVKKLNGIPGLTSDANGSGFNFTSDVP